MFRLCYYRSPMFAIVLVVAMIIAMLIPSLRVAPVGVANATTTFPGSSGKIVFSSFLGIGNIYCEQDLYIMNANGTGLKVLPAADRCNSYPSFSADGRKITFVGLGYNSKVGVLGNSTIYMMNVNGTGVRQLTSWTGLLASPSFSPDGSKIVFVSDRDYPKQDYNKHSKIYVMSIIGTDIKRLTKTSSTLSDDDYPSFSPDGTQIVFTRGTYDHSEIYIMNADGSGLKRMITTPRSDDQPTWQPIIDSSSLPSMISVHDDEYYEILLSEADLFQWSELLFWSIG